MSGRRQRGRPSSVDKVMTDITASRTDGTYRLGRFTLSHGSGAKEVVFLNIDGPSEMDALDVEQRIERAMRRFASDLVDAGMAEEPTPARADGDSEAA